MIETTLRFRDATGGLYPAWAQAQLRDMCQYSTEHGSGENYIGTENMYQNFAGVDVDELRTGKGIVYHTGDTLMSNIRPYLKKTWLADRDGICSTDVLVFKPKGISPEFLYQMISSERFVQYVMSGAKGSKMPRGDKDHILDYSFMCPGMEEQRRIASLLSAIDARITEQEVIIADLEKCKKGLMQKIFSQELRFKADDGSEFPIWKDTEIRDIATAKVGKKPNTILQNETPYEYINAGTTISGYTSSYNREGDTVTTPSRGQGGIGFVGYQKERFWLGPLCYGITSFDENVLTKYLYYFLKHHANLIIDCKQTGTVPAVNQESLLHIGIQIPCKEEQTKIISLFSCIDEHLDNEYAVLLKWKTIKKGLLQQMFV